MKASRSLSRTASGAEAGGCTSERARRIHAALSDSSEEIVSLVERLARIESPSDDPESQLEVLELVTEELDALGLRTRRMSGRQSGGYLLGVPRARRKGAPFQLLIGHCDTVWPHGTLATMPIERRKGRLSGPGVYDMKGGLTVMLSALKVLKDLGLEPQVTPLVLINSDEEIGSPDSRGPISRLARLVDRALILEPAAGRSGKLKTARKGVSRYTFRVTGKAAHSGTEPDRGASAILELSHLVQSLFALNNPEEGISVNVGTISGGLRANVVAPTSQAVIDVRVVTQEQGDRIDRAIRELRPLDPRVSLDIQGGLETLPLERTPRNRALWKTARELGRELGLELKQAQVGGASDGNTTSLYTATLDGLGPVGGGAHASHEFIEIDSLVERAALLALILLADPVASS